MIAGRTFSESARGQAVWILAGLILATGNAGAGSKETFDPLGFPGDDSVVTARAVPIPAVTVTVQRRADSSRVARQGTQPATWQVQFFASTDVAEAQDVLRRAVASLADSVALVFETPYYKLRAGNFASREQAEALAVKLRAMGYESAWVVPSRPTPRGKPSDQ